MAYKTLKYYSTIAANNATINGTNYFPEGQAPSTVNDAARQTMADLAAFYQASYAAFQARLTLTSATPVTTSDVTAAGTIYLTPYKGNLIWLYDGAAQWNAFNLTEISLALSLTSGKPYDVFVYDNAGTPTLETLVWTNDTTRATALATQDGILVKTGATTRRYAGSIYASGANTTEDSLVKRYVWNYYNRVFRAMRAVEATNTWSYSTATYQQANASTANQLDYMCGVLEDAVTARVTAAFLNSSATKRVAQVGIGVDSTTVNSAINGQNMATANDAQSLGTATYVGFPGVGRHFLAWLERGAGADTQTWYGDDGGVITQAGIVGECFA